MERSAHMSVATYRPEGMSCSTWHGPLLSCESMLSGSSVQGSLLPVSWFEGVGCTVGTKSLGRIRDICTFRQCCMAQLHTSAAVQLGKASQPARLPVYWLAGAESACSAYEVSVKAEVLDRENGEPRLGRSAARKRHTAAVKCLFPKVVVAQQNSSCATTR